MLYNGNVETSPLHRRASRILAIAVTPKRKTRELLLTNRRLLCLKRKPNRPYVIRYEWLLTRPTSEKEKEKEKDIRHQIVNVELKTDREFVVMTVSYLTFLGDVDYLLSYLIRCLSSGNKITFLPCIQFSFSLNVGNQDSRSN